MIAALLSQVGGSRRGTFFVSRSLAVVVESPFDVLLIDSDADDEEIEQAYRRRVKETHPDHGGSAAEFQLVRAAYEAIKAGRYGERYDVDGESDDRYPRNQSRVEYLNYEVLDDYGWDLDDDDLFEKSSTEALDSTDRGRLLVQPRETLLEAAENRGFRWPYACRGGACANCAVAVAEGEMSQPVNHVLPPEMVDRGIRLSCVGEPITEELKVVYNLKHLPDLDELRLSPRPFEQAYVDE